MNTVAATPPARRGRFEGVVNIVRFNWPIYAMALAVIACAGLGAALLPVPHAWALAAGWGAGVAAFYLVASLAVSHAIYDRSDLYRWAWLGRVRLPVAGNSDLVNLHSGFDETSEALRKFFPGGRWRMLDFHDPARHTEPSIARARRHRPPPAGTESVQADALPLGDGGTDAIFCILAAHEVRDHAGKVALAREVRRALRTGGTWVVVEHLRDAANFLAYGPGCRHFFPHAEWLGVFAAAELRVADEFRLTPFVRVFVLRRDD